MSKAARKKAEENIESLKKKRNAKSKIELTEHEYIIATDLVFPSELNITFDDIGGLEEIKSKIFESVILPFKRPELFQNRKGKLNRLEN